MDNLKKYYGILILIATILVLYSIANISVVPIIKELEKSKNTIEKAKDERKTVQKKLERVQERIQKTKNAIATAQKKIYSPIESDLGNDTLFFTIYDDVVEMIRSNSVKIKSIEYTYNPENDAFVKFGKDVYFVCDVDMDLIANYVNLGKLVQDIYQYPYYIKINKLEVIPYEKDKKLLIATLSLRLYAHTSADNIVEISQ